MMLYKFIFRFLFKLESAIFYMVGKLVVFLPPYARNVFLYELDKSLVFFPASIRNLLLFEIRSAIGLATSKPLLLDRKAENYINLGSGSMTFSDYINIDFFSANADYQADLRYPLKIEDDIIDGILTEHTLEHLTYDQVQSLLMECYRILKPGGKIRIIVPDVSIFVKNYCLDNNDWFSKWEKRVFLDSKDASRRNRKMISKMTAISFVTQEYGHVSCWDFETLEKFLIKGDFVDIMKLTFRKGSDKKLLRDVDSDDRILASLYVEASK